MYDDLNSRHRLEGMMIGQVEAILGPPDAMEDAGPGNAPSAGAFGSADDAMELRYYYELGATELGVVDPETLVICFRDGAAVRIEKI